VWGWPVFASDSLVLGRYEDNFVKEAPVRPLTAPPRYFSVGNGQCIAFLQANGFEVFKGSAWEWKKYINSDIGWPGYAVLLDEGPYQHVALITGNNEGYQLVEQNYLGEYIVSTRSIPFDYERIVGFIRP